MARLTRQQLKKDEFAERMAFFQEFFLQNQQKLMRWGGIGVLVAILVVAGYLVVRNRQDKASAELGQALATYHAPLNATPQPNSGQLTFKTDAERNQEALKKFTALSGNWGTTGKYARYYAALIKRNNGNPADAEKELRDLSGESGDLGALAKLALAGVLVQNGKLDEAEKRYKELESSPTVMVPKAAAQLALAQLYQKTKPAQAVTLAQQMQKDYSGTAAGDAATKIIQGSAQ